MYNPDCLKPKNVKVEDKSDILFMFSLEMLTFASAFSKTGKSYTASSLRILQDGNVAKVVGCSGAM